MPIRRFKDIYKEFVDLREEIMKHKWIESEKAGYDVGLEFAITDWMKNHRQDWLESRKERNSYDC